VKVFDIIRSSVPKKFWPTLKRYN